MTVEGELVTSSDEAAVNKALRAEELQALFQKLIPAFIFSVLLLVCIVAMACRNIVRYFTGYSPNEPPLPDEENQNNISSYKLSDNLEDTISPQNAKQLVVDSKMTDVIYT